METNKKNYGFGAPFFKDSEAKRDFSQGSHQTKPKSGNHTNMSNNGSEKSEKSREKENIRKRNMEIASVFFEREEHMLWAW